jgi:hypothetical protein
VCGILSAFNSSASILVLSQLSRDEGSMALTLRYESGFRSLPFNTCPLFDGFLGAIAREQSDLFQPTSVAPDRMHEWPASALSGSANRR